ncbi:Spy/CpxP family protein refolding chaperone [Xylophilus sp. GW821-FHT01B05]
MRFIPRHLLIASVLASSGFAAFAQTPPPPADGAAPPPAEARHHGPRGERPDRAGMQRRMDAHFAQLKQRLQLSADQQGAWDTFTSAVRPGPDGPGGHARLGFDRGEFAKLTTPERIDRMRALRLQRQAEMDRREDAIKTFYATLTPAQQKTFDSQPMHHMGPDGHPGPRGEHGHKGGPRKGPPPAATDAAPQPKS